MKFLIYLSLILLPLSYSVADYRDPGTGSNPAVGPGPASPDAGSSDTSVMGGGTPGSQGMNNIDTREPTEEELETMYQQREEVKKEKGKKDKKQKQKAKEPVTDQDRELDTMRAL